MSVHNLNIKQQSDAVQQAKIHLAAANRLAEVDHEPLASFGALTTRAITDSTNAAHNIRTVRNVKGPELRVL